MVQHALLRKPQSGFTIIELVVVIVLLGVLAATALPRFIDISTDAQKAVLQSMGGSILSAANLVHAKAVIQGISNEPLTTIDLDGDGVDDVEIRYGYPSASRNNGLSKIMGGDFSTGWTWSTTYGDTRFWLTTAKLGGRSGVYVNQTAVLNSGCYILYDPATTQGGSPAVSYVTTNC
ncbi:prepilin-type N-terminal cleavage/methylation domain-containing protein [Neptunomonas phycophila]|uniref:prepilin-type N-terminal cleavage/methylation domain-containing protein n=1 Tax=Neptunomonas phycophila TaxID=1572645 RepID=UPI000948DBB7|nr:prepilin-type N-terminal cleavage/methylation domain-containing protein [Neptunomonas phycophila]QLE97479.1 prepilin-type N-terminal cleavage/methylation domain-containing protein [Neptunomonas phycophila]